MYSMLFVCKVGKVELNNIGGIIGYHMVKCQMYCEADFINYSGASGFFLSDDILCLEYLERLKMKWIASFWSFWSVLFMKMGQGQRQSYSNGFVVVEGLWWWWRIGGGGLLNFCMFTVLYVYLKTTTIPASGTMNEVHGVLYSIQCTLYNMHCTVYMEHIQSRVYNDIYIYILLYILYISVIHNVQCTHWMSYTLYSVHCIKITL